MWFHISQLLPKHVSVICSQIICYSIIAWSYLKRERKHQCQLHMQWTWVFIKEWMKLLTSSWQSSNLHLNRMYDNWFQCSVSYLLKSLVRKTLVNSQLLLKYLVSQQLYYRRSPYRSCLRALSSCSSTGKISYGSWSSDFEISMYILNGQN